MTSCFRSSLTASKFADSQISGTLKGIGVSAKVDRPQDGADRFRQGLADLRPGAFAAGLPALRHVEGVSLERRHVAGGVRPLPHESAGGRPLPRRRPPGAAVHHARSRAQGSAARLSGLRAYRDPQRAGDRHAHEPVPHRPAGHRLRQPRPRRAGQERRRQHREPAGRQHDRPLHLPDRPRRTTSSATRTCARRRPTPSTTSCWRRRSGAASACGRGAAPGRPRPKYRRAIRAT